MEKKTVVLATYGKTREHQHGDCIDAVEHGLGILVMKTRGSPQIDIARSLLAYTALAHGADVCLFVDHDILFEPLDVEVLAESARQTRGIVGAPYSERRMGGGLVGGFASDVDEATFFDGGGLYPSPGAIGMGFTAIHRDVFALLDPLPEYAACNCSDGQLRPYFRKLILDGHWLHEDASFCEAARRAGAPTHIDTRIRVQHLGEYPYGVEDCRVSIPRKNSLTIRVQGKK